VIAEGQLPTTITSRTRACRDCDALLSVPSTIRATFHCPRCHGVVLRRASRGLDSALAFYLTACVFFIVANLFPIVQIEAGGITVHTTLVGAARALQAEHMTLIALVVIVTAVDVGSGETMTETEGATDACAGSIIAKRLAFDALERESRRRLGARPRRLFGQTP
jgi:uncharacterized paraquat-inducible protein A